MLAWLTAEYIYIKYIINMISNTAVNNKPSGLTLCLSHFRSCHLLFLHLPKKRMAVLFKKNKDV